MGNRLQDKVVLVTGGGTGIGAATAIRCAEEGATVVISGRREEPLNEVVSQIKGAGGKAVYRQSDAGDEDSVSVLVNSVAEEFGSLDILVNNAVSMAGGGLIPDTSKDDWDGTFRVTLEGVFYAVRAAMPIMARQGAGAIVNVSSVCALQGTPYTGAYSAAKAGVIGFSRAAAMEGAADNIRVNVVIPGIVMTPATEATLPDENATRASANAVPIKRIAEPVELANAILFLASDEASYITGTELIVDGGKSAELNTGAANMEAHEM